MISIGSVAHCFIIQLTNSLREILDSTCPKAWLAFAVLVDTINLFVGCQRPSHTIQCSLFALTELHTVRTWRSPRAFGLLLSTRLASCSRVSCLSIGIVLWLGGSRSTSTINVRGTLFFCSCFRSWAAHLACFARVRFVIIRVFVLVVGINHMTAHVYRAVEDGVRGKNNIESCRPLLFNNSSAAGDARESRAVRVQWRAVTHSLRGNGKWQIWGKK
jgi:hypothetical protein